jgi:hypothetical protein
MKADLRAETDPLNRNVDEMIRLFQCTTDAKVCTAREARLHTTRLELMRAKLNADFRELLHLHECPKVDASTHKK